MIINESANWKQGTEKLERKISWFTDGSKTAEGVGAGAFSKDLNAEFSAKLSDHSTVMHAETAGIELAVTETLRRGTHDRNVLIFVDSQAILRALSNNVIRSASVRNCAKALNLLGLHNRVTLLWVPSHQGIDGNEKADALAKAGAAKSSVDIITLQPESHTNNLVETWCKNSHLKSWKNLPMLEHSKLFLSHTDGSRRETLLKLSKCDLRVAIGILTGHGCLNGFLFKIGKSDTNSCRHCQANNENMRHLLLDCDALANTRIKFFHSPNPKSDSIDIISAIENL